MTNEANGYAKMPLIDFDTFNNAATVKANENKNKLDCDPYTFYFHDTDPLYCWARIEHDYITELPILSYDDAILAGMIVIAEGLNG